MPTKKIPEHALQDALSEHSTSGSHIGLTERLDNNIQLIKSMCNENELKISYFTLGKYTNTKTAVLYMPHVASDAVYSSVCASVSDMVSYHYLPHINAIAEQLRPSNAIIYTMHKTSERFDEVVTDLMQGKIIIICDNTPYALTVPITFFEQFQAADDYYTDYGKYSRRILRMLSFLIAMLLPAIYLALEKNHPAWLPDKLFNAGEIMPTLLEELFLLTFWRIAIDSSIRVNRALAVMITVIIAFVLSETAVNSHLINPFDLISIGITTICAFSSMTEFRLPLLIAGRYITLFAAQFWGLQGVCLSTLALFAYGCTLRTYGMPYMYPFCPFSLSGMKDILYRGKLSRLWGGKHRL